MAVDENMLEMMKQTFGYSDEEMTRWKAEPRNMQMAENMIDMPRENVPERMELKIGMAVQLTDQSGNPVPAIIAELADDTIKLDLNHPLSGKTLVFEIEIHETGLEPDPQCDSGSDCGGCSGSCS